MHCTQYSYLMNHDVTGSYALQQDYGNRYNIIDRSSGSHIFLEINNGHIWDKFLSNHNTFPQMGTSKTFL